MQGSAAKVARTPTDTVPSFWPGESQKGRPEDEEALPEGRELEKEMPSLSVRPPRSQTDPWTKHAQDRLKPAKHRFEK